MANRKTYSPLNHHQAILSTSKGINYFGARRDEIFFAFDPTYFED